jgi:thiamine biosynthesis lipoprotein
MTEPQIQHSDLNSLSPAAKNASRFFHEAMATTYELFIANKTPDYARSAATDAFKLVDRLEGQLSKFISNSDVSRINRLPANQPLLLGLETFECLQISRCMFDQTKGAFDITAGALLNCVRNKDSSPRAASKDEIALALKHTGTNLLQLDQSEHTVELLIDAVQIDLGGIGKGYAVDKIAELLHEWSIDSALISGGYSSVLALNGPADAQGWPVTISNPANHGQVFARILLQARALSSSGLQKGQHIIDPRTALPVGDRLAAWSSAADAATADALSTAFMVMSLKEIEQYCADHPDTSAMIVLPPPDKIIKKDKILLFGSWKKDELLI